MDTRSICCFGLWAWLLLAASPAVAQSEGDVAKLRQALLEPAAEVPDEPHVHHSSAGRSLFRAYQAALSRHLGNSCPYAPDCQTYCRQAFDHKSDSEALALSLDRMTRCNRLVILLEGVRRHELRDNRLYDPLPR
jgi:putative component of membrane protein insertase Oxa1/YidC/SpoIIIJ protein YidD